MEEVESRLGKVSEVTVRILFPVTGSAAGGGRTVEEEKEESAAPPPLAAVA